MNVKTIKKSIDIQAPREKVWDVLLNERYTRTWYQEFSEGSHAQTDWKVGSKALFTDNTQAGMVARVVQNKPHEVLSVEYEGIVVDGREDYQSEEARAFKGGHETYRLWGKNGFTELAVQSDITEQHYEYMKEAWDRALQAIKNLSEAN